MDGPRPPAARAGRGIFVAGLRAELLHLIVLLIADEASARRAAE